MKLKKILLGLALVILNQLTWADEVEFSKQYNNCMDKIYLNETQNLGYSKCHFRVYSKNTKIQKYKNTKIQK